MSSIFKPPSASKVNQIYLYFYFLIVSYIHIYFKTLILSVRPDLTDEIVASILAFVINHIPRSDEKTFPEFLGLVRQKLPSSMLEREQKDNVDAMEIERPTSQVTVEGLEPLADVIACAESVWALWGALNVLLSTLSQISLDY